ncbi:MAG: DsbE family thiol:disulfide interchange protein [Rhodobacteraceae bacterium]|jgi:cytochrome c biogenesis protein CcmG, thiol:disulfide interchange protein DsbE|nr:DsbE family thiol:disulfide interchange protein [Paracoccaceae bacterium]
MRKLVLALPPLVFIGLAVMFWWGMNRADPHDMPSVFLGKPAPAIEQAALTGIPAPMQADLAGGQVTVVNFWASWCPPCRAEHPTLKALAAEGIQVIGVNMMDREADALAFLDADGNPFVKIAFDPKGKTRLEWGVTAPPETFILNGKGEVLYRFIGPLVGDDYLNRFRPELEKALAAE